MPIFGRESEPLLERDLQNAELPTLDVTHELLGPSIPHGTRPLCCTIGHLNGRLLWTAHTPRSWMKDDFLTSYSNRMGDLEKFLGG